MEKVKQAHNNSDGECGKTRVREREPERERETEGERKEMGIGSKLKSVHTLMCFNYWDLREFKIHNGSIRLIGNKTCYSFKGY